MPTKSFSKPSGGGKPNGNMVSISHPAKFGSKHRSGASNHSKSPIWNQGHCREHSQCSKTEPRVAGVTLAGRQPGWIPATGGRSGDPLESCFKNLWHVHIGYIDRLQDASSNKYLQTSISKRAWVNLTWNANRFEVSLGSFVSPELVLGFICWTCHVGHLPGIDSTRRFQWHPGKTLRCPGAAFATAAATGAGEHPAPLWRSRLGAMDGEKSSGPLVGWTQDGKVVWRSSP